LAGLPRRPLAIQREAIPRALRGLETALAPHHAPAETSLASRKPLATHLITMPRSFRGDTKLSAWIEVERGHLLEKVGRADAARAAFETRLDSTADRRSRDAYTRHLLLQGQDRALIKAWPGERA